MIRFASVSVGSGGLVRCSRCHGGAQPPHYDSEHEIVGRINAAIESWEGPPGPNLSLEGADPFGHPGLPLIVGAAVRGGARRIRLATDASALRSPVNASGSVSAGVRHIEVTLLGGAPGIHDALSGVPGAMDAALAGMRSFRSAAEAASVPVHVGVTIPACRHNSRDLPAAVGAAVEAGADTIRVRIDDAGIDLASAAAWLSSACDTGVVNGVWVEVDGAPFCLLPDYDLHVADTLRPRSGAKAGACAACPLDTFCGGAPGGAPADTLAVLNVPAGADRLRRALAVSRAGEAGHA